MIYGYSSMEWFKNDLKVYIREHISGYYHRYLYVTMYCFYDFVIMKLVPSLLFISLFFEYSEKNPSFNCTFFPSSSSPISTKLMSRTSITLRSPLSSTFLSPSCACYRCTPPTLACTLPSSVRSPPSLTYVLALHGSQLIKSIYSFVLFSLYFLPLFQFAVRFDYMVFPSISSVYS